VERELTLTNITAPRLGRRRTQNNRSVREDQPFAWQSREFLRKRLVGKQVSYLIETKDPKSGKEYATVFQDNENVAVHILAEGWATLRSNVSKDRPELAPLVGAQESAEKSNRGVWNKEQEEKHKRDLEKEVNTAVLFDSTKGKPQPAVVEQVVTGSRFRLTLHNKDLNSIELLLSGVESPNIPIEGQAQPFAREAKFFSEHWLLNRDVQVLVEGADKHTLYGSIVAADFNISEELLKAGLAKFVEWSAQRTAFLSKLKAAEKDAKTKKLRVWRNYVEPKPLTAEEKKRELRTGKELLGKVSRVINAGAINVMDAQGHTHEVHFSSLKLPRSGNTASKGDIRDETREEGVERTLAWEGKEFTRKRLMDQKVRAVLDYVRPESKRGPTDTLPERPYYSVYLDKTNVGVELVEHGLATVQPHKAGEQRSRDYEYLLFAEERAKKAQKGKHTDMSKAAIVKIHDLTSTKTAKVLEQAKGFLPTLRRNGKTKGVVEYVFSGSRFKLYVPRESCVINFILAVAKTPRLGSEQSKVHEPFAEEAFKFSASRAQQRDVEFEVIDQDRSGNFIGNLWVNKVNLSASLLEEGLATSNRGALNASEYSREYHAAEENAKRARKNLWKDYDPAVEEAKRQARFEAERKEEQQNREAVKVHVTEIVNANQFFVQVVTAESNQLEELMTKLEAAESKPVTPTAGQLVRAQFTEDDRFYRGRITKLYSATSEVDVKYIDYGNSERLPLSRVSQLEQSFQALKPQAQLAQLAFIRAPKLDEDFGEDAAEYLRELVWDRPTTANIQYKDNDVLFLCLFDSEDETFVNASLLNAGLAKLEKVRGRQFEQLLDSLRGEETSARQQHRGIWQYGDVDSDDDEPRERKKPAAKGPAAKAGKK